MSAAISRSATIKGLRAKLPGAIEMLLDDEKIPDAGYAEIMAKIGHSTLLAYCKQGFKEEDDGFISVYNGQLDKLMWSAADALGRERAERLAQWLNSHGYFMKYALSGGMREYVFSQRPDEEITEETVEEEL